MYYNYLLATAKEEPDLLGFFQNWMFSIVYFVLCNKGRSLGNVTAHGWLGYRRDTIDQSEESWLCVNSCVSVCMKLCNNIYLHECLVDLWCCYNQAFVLFVVWIHTCTWKDALKAWSIICVRKKKDKPSSMERFTVRLNVLKHIFEGNRLYSYAQYYTCFVHINRITYILMYHCTHFVFIKKKNQ